MRVQAWTGMLRWAVAEGRLDASPLARWRPLHGPQTFRRSEPRRLRSGQSAGGNRSLTVAARMSPSVGPMVPGEPRSRCHGPTASIGKTVIGRPEPRLRGVRGQGIKEVPAAPVGQQLASGTGKVGGAGSGEARTRGIGHTWLQRLTAAPRRA